MPLNNSNDASKIKIRRDTLLHWNDITPSPVLDEGEIGIVWTDDTKTEYNIKIGNGITPFNQLPYFKGSKVNGEETPYISYDELNEQTLLSINGVKLKPTKEQDGTINRNISLIQLGIQPIGSYASGEELNRLDEAKADKEDVYDKAQVDNIIDNVRQLPDYSQEDNKYLKIVHGAPIYSSLDDGYVTQEKLDEELDKKVDKVNGYSLVNELQYEGLSHYIDSLQTNLGEITEPHNYMDLVNDVAGIHVSLEDKADIGEALPENRSLDKYLLISDFNGSLDNYATLDDIAAKANSSDLVNHMLDETNPHHVTITQIGLSADYLNYNTPADLPASDETKQLINAKQDAFTVDTTTGLELTNDVLRNTNPYYPADWSLDSGNGAILNKPTNEQFQADWNITDTNSLGYIRNKPVIEEYVLPEAQEETLGGVKLGEDFYLDQDGHLKYNTGVVNWSDIQNKPTIMKGDQELELHPRMTLEAYNIASLSVAKAIDERLEEEKADKTEITRLDERIDNIPSLDNVYTKTEVDDIVSRSANLAVFNSSTFYPQGTVGEAIKAKADVATTLAGYGITNAYTKTQVDTKLSDKADVSIANTKQDKDKITQDISTVIPGEKEIYYPSVAAIDLNNAALATDYEGKIAAAKTTIESEIDAVDDRVDATNLNISTNYYTSSAVDNLLDEVVRFKGSVVYSEDLPASPSKGDLYHVDYMMDETTQSYAEFKSCVVYDGNQWVDLVQDMQTTTNLVTSISSSSTDEQYPSAKCVYDLIGDIETLINAL